MIRYFLARGDRAKDAVIIEGLDGVTCSNPPPSVQIATLHMKTYCHACKKEGFIAPKGPRHPGTGPNGKAWALSGDINVCDCDPAPVFYAERGMKMVLKAQEVAEFTGQSANTNASRTASQQSPKKRYDQQFTLRDDKGIVLPDAYYTVRMPSGELIHGTTDSMGRTARYTTDDAQDITVHLGHKGT